MENLIINYKQQVILNTLPTVNDEPSVWASWYDNLKKYLGTKRAVVVFTNLYSKTNYKKKNSQSDKLVSLMKERGIDLNDASLYEKFKLTTGIEDYFGDVKSLLWSVLGIGAVGLLIYTGFKVSSKIH